MGVPQTVTVTYLYLLGGMVAGKDARRYMDARSRRLNALPDEVCPYCKGSGVRHDVYVAPAGLRGECSGCKGTGTRRPCECGYMFDVDTVREFASFLETCGGFRIY